MAQKLAFVFVLAVVPGFTTTGVVKCVCVFFFCEFFFVVCLQLAVDVWGLMRKSLLGSHAQESLALEIPNVRNFFGLPKHWQENPLFFFFNNYSLRYSYVLFYFLLQNLPAERKWPEVNQRVIYLIKEVLVGMENGLLINLNDPAVQFCVSFITMNVAEVGIQRVSASWNLHPLEGLQNLRVNVEFTCH